MYYSYPKVFPVCGIFSPNFKMIVFYLISMCVCVCMCVFPRASIYVTVSYPYDWELLGGEKSEKGEWEFLLHYGIMVN